MVSRPGRSSRFRKAIIEAAGVSRGTKVIDIATAVGGMAFAAQEHGANVTAIDASGERIGIAKRNPNAAGIDFRVMDATKTTFADKEFDVAIISLGLHEMTVEGAKAALVEARRIAKRLVVVEFGLAEWPAFWRIFRYALGIFEPKGFFEFTRHRVDAMIDAAGWKISKRILSFPFVAYLCD